MIGQTPFDTNTTYEVHTRRTNRRLRRRLPEGTWSGQQHSGMPREIDPNDGPQMSIVTHFDAITETENSV